MRLFLATSCKMCLLVVAFGSAFGQTADPDVHAARAAERREALRLGGKLSVSTEPVKVSVSEMGPRSKPTSEGTPVADTPAASQRTSHSREATVSGTSAAANPRDGSRNSRVPSRARATAVVPFASSHKPPTPIQPAEDAPEAEPALDSERPDKIALLAQLDQPNRMPAKESPRIGKTVLFTVLKLAVVLVLAYLTIVVLKWISVRHDVLPHGRRDFKTVDTMRLSSTSSLHLVDVKGKYLLVGCSNGQVNLLREFESDESDEVDSPSDKRFAEHLAKYSGTSGQNGPTRRIGGLLRDCTAYLRDRRQGAAQAAGSDVGVTDET